MKCCNKHLESYAFHSPGKTLKLKAFFIVFNRYTSTLRNATLQ